MLFYELFERIGKKEFEDIMQNTVRYKSLCKNIFSKSQNIVQTLIDMYIDIKHLDNAIYLPIIKTYIKSKND